VTLPPAFLARPIAHRGLHDRARGVVENSRDAFAAAIKAGYGIECDLQLSADDEAMVFHDYDLHRLTGEAGPVRQRDARALEALTLTDSTNQIEALPALLEQVAGQVPLLIELKDQDGAMGPNVGTLERRTAEALHGYQGDVAVMSFNPHSTRRLHELMPGIPCGIVTSAYTPEDWAVLPAATRDRLRDIPDYQSSGACFISHEASDLARPRVGQLKQEGAAILCWTIRSQSAADTARKIADNITFEGFLPT
jgi:glycerophosphoryl diester phosphodiesterase